jgi:hypothetical protein
MVRKWTRFTFGRRKRGFQLCALSGYPPLVSVLSVGTTTGRRYCEAQFRQLQFNLTYCTKRAGVTHVAGAAYAFLGALQSPPYYTLPLLPTLLNRRLCNGGTTVQEHY